MMSRIFRMNISKRIMLHYSRGKKNKNKAPKRNKISFRKEKLMSQISNQRDHRNIEACYQDLEAPTPIPTTSSVTHMVDENFSVVSGRCLSCGVLR